MNWQAGNNFLRCKREKCLKLIIVLLLLTGGAAICGHADIVVDQKGNGDYQTITAAIEALPMFAYQRADIDRLMFTAGAAIREDDLAGELQMLDGAIIASTAGIHERALGPQFEIVFSSNAKQGAQ